MTADEGEDLLEILGWISGAESHREGDALLIHDSEGRELASIEAGESAAHNLFIAVTELVREFGNYETGDFDPDTTVMFSRRLGGPATAVTLVSVDGAKASLFSRGGFIDVPRWPTEFPLDSGAALLQPITVAEHADVERLLHLLWDAAASDQLTAGQEEQIRGIARLIDDIHRAAEPGSTERWTVIGVIRGGLKFLGRGDVILAQVIAWPKIIDVLHDARWFDTAGDLLRQLPK